MNLNGDSPRSPDRSPMFIRGMHGLGDNLHQRAVVRQLIPRHDIWLETSWVSLYHDMPIKLLNRPINLRTQSKNAQRERKGFSLVPPPQPRSNLVIHYPPRDVQRFGSPLAAMCRNAGVDPDIADFRLPIPAQWLAKAQNVIDGWNTAKPLMIYRPLVERPRDWRGCAARNPDFNHYADLYAAIRDRFFVASVADLQDGYEWMVGRDVPVNVRYNKGELEFETLAAVISLVDMVFCSPGFAVPLAQAVGTPVICVFGGYENAKSFQPGGRYSPYLGIDTMCPCNCFKHNHGCDKRIDMTAAVPRMEAFADAAIGAKVAIQSPAVRPERTEYAVL